MKKRLPTARAPVAVKRRTRPQLDRRTRSRATDRAAARELARIRHHLRDGLCQELAGIALQLHTLHAKMTRRQHIAPTDIAAIVAQLQTAIRDARRALCDNAPHP